MEPGWPGRGVELVVGVVVDFPSLRVLNRSEPLQGDGTFSAHPWPFWRCCSWRVNCRPSCANRLAREYPVYRHDNAPLLPSRC